MEIYAMCEYELPITSRLSKVIVSQTDIHTDATKIIYHAASRLVNKCNIDTICPYETYKMQNAIGTTDCVYSHF